MYHSFLVWGRLPFRAADNPFLIEWAAILRPTYEVPSAYTCMHSLLPAEDVRVMHFEIKRLSENHRLTALLDGWDDAMRRALYGTMACERGVTPVVLGLEDMTGQRGDAETLRDVLERGLGTMEVKAKQLIAVVSDDPTTMRKYRRLVEQKWPWIVVCLIVLCSMKHF